ncbi:MAG TPA: chemotaxis protein CheW [Bryobacteraceae bacterium]|nr:chemotaxis protein CheW [Bryobacteraceae bacterium]
MSELNLDDELVQDYLAECREHLATIENDLLAIEQGGAEIDEQLVNRVFRAAHSIKGGAGFFDLTKIRELAHRTENALDLIRSRQMVPTPEAVSILLLAFDKLRDLIGNYRTSNQADIGEFVLALTALAAGSLPEHEKGSLSERVTVQVPEANKGIQVSAFDLSQVRKGGKRVYLIAFDLIHDIERRNKTPWEVFKRLIKCGTILETVFDLDSAGTLDDEPSNRLMLEVLYATVLEPDLLEALVEVPPERIRLIENDGAIRPLAEPVGVTAAAPRTVKPQVEATSPPVTTPAEDAPKAVTATPTPASEATIRLNVTLLDSLMTLAGELVLSRNQLNESLARQDDRGIRSGAQRVSLVTSELQEVVTLTRMQPVGSLFSKFPRLVRDLARDLAKDVQLKLEGGEVEIDKTILEGLSDPLTHMVRNAVDHGIEPSLERTAAGKSATGTVTLKASHQAGQVVIEISDDGKGLAAEKIAASSIAKGLVTREQVQGMSDREKMALVFLPGVSTAEKVSDISGRGVGMDVVKTNLDRLGGKIEIDSAPGQGSRFRIKLPLTLAIIPSLLVSDSGQRFAIPQVNVGELIRIPSAQVAERTDRVGDALVLIVRDRLVPLLYLANALGVSRPENSSRALNVVLVDAGTFEYGLVVEELHDTVEIVVKPLGRHMKGLHDYAGATILGDGRVAVILDVAGLAARANLTAGTAEASTRQTVQESASGRETHSLLVFHNAPAETCAVPIEQVSRIERVRPAQVLNLGGRRTMQYCGASLPLVSLHDTAPVGELSPEQQWVVIVFERLGHPLGLLAAEPLDMVEAALNIDTVTLRQRGIAGSAVLKDRTILLLDIFELADAARPERGPAEPPKPMCGSAPGEDALTVLVADDSEFFRGQIQRLIEAIGCRVLAAEDGQAAWEILDHHSSEVDLVATDIEMPRLDGLALTRQIRADRRFAGLPVIALSSLAGEEEIARGMAAGVDEYQIKLNKDELTESIRKAAVRKKTNPASRG